MSKREIFSQTHYNRDNKRPKLDLSVAEQNFAGNEHQSENKWGDDIEDEVLLIASQVCEASFSSKNSTLPGYSICMQPKLTSTQICQPQILGKNEFPFKIPLHTSAYNATAESNVANLADKINNHVDFKEKTLDELRLYVSHLQDENSKLISENIDITNKYRSKEGETKILRDNLLSHKKSVENLKLEQVHAQEEIQRQFNEKLAVVNSEVESLKAQLDSKNLEIMNLKKRRALDSHNVKVTHVTLSANETMPRHLYRHPDPKKSVNDSGIQTDLKSEMLHLKKPLRIGGNSSLENGRWCYKSSVLEFIQYHFAPVIIKAAYRRHHRRQHPYAAGINQTPIISRQSLSISIYKQIKLFLSEVLLQLETLEQRMTIAFQKEADQEYINATAKYIPIIRTDLLQAKYTAFEFCRKCASQQKDASAMNIHSFAGAPWFNSNSLLKCF
ncbi:hypothetical protein EVAR_83703_1 [Eumeta japonica]|uniref:Uncharacterized protein n=1 Tax=Eumeta variegata TaxID=151549 RepID=A0A4C1WBZ3_EUMVA|nr:hypothetical protein EVAR_83703_1 [Eumeta japonica]